MRRSPAFNAYDASMVRLDSEFSDRAISILRGFARSASGMVTESTPLSYEAEILSVSIPSPSES